MKVDGEIPEIIRVENYQIDRHESAVSSRVDGGGGVSTAAPPLRRVEVGKLSCRGIMGCTEPLFGLCYQNGGRATFM
jgi:hypothetical protein